MRFFFITNSPELAQFAITQGVERIFVDLEIIGKVERQGHLSTVISRHCIDDVAAIRAVLPQAKIMVRVNPLHADSATEVDRAVEAGATTLMLPMFRSADAVAEFAEMIAGRAQFCPLVETAGAMKDIEEIAAIEDVDEVHIGLNDLSLDLGLDFMFEPLPLGMIDEMASALRLNGKRFGIGGLARADEGLLPARTLIGEHVRLGSTAAILSRTFHRESTNPEDIQKHMNFREEVALLNQIEATFQSFSQLDLERNRKEAWESILEIKRRRTGF